MARKEIGGTVQYQIDVAVNFLIRNLRVGARIKGIYREVLYCKQGEHKSVRYVCPWIDLPAVSGPESGGIPHLAHAHIAGA